MPLTFIDIERQKNWRIGLFFLFLMLLYFSLSAVLASSLLVDPLHRTTRFWIFVSAASLFIAGVHFWFSARDTVNAVVKTLDARPPDPQDDVHTRFINIMHEIHVVTGNKRNIRSAVIPSLSLNALAASDLKGNAIIAITEGLLSRLTRPQLEAVIAHEAHHILSGDCLETTVAASIFGTFSSAIEKIGRGSRGRAFSSPAFLLAWVLLKLSYLLNLFISREREYRADAASVRMTRNPISLAETLHLLSRSWRGAGFIGSGFEMLCIVNPQMTALDETEGFWADLLSTHPPLRKRMDILLGMARVSIAELDARAAHNAAAQSAGEQNVAGQKYYAMSPAQQWQGPFTLAGLETLPWLSPLTWIATGEGRSAERAWKEPLINAHFVARLSMEKQAASDFTCPACRQPLVMTPCEGTQVYRCRFCSGTLAGNDKIPRLLARAQRPCTDRMNALTKTVLKENQARYVEQKLSGGNKSRIPLLSCPKCKNPMMRGFYSLAYLIETDRCGFCGLTWFDRDELEMLQCLIKNRAAGERKEA